MHKPESNLNVELARILNNTQEAILDFLGSDTKITKAEVQRALTEEMNQPLPQFGSGTESPSSLKILNKLRGNTNPNTLQVIAKMLKTARVAAMTWRGGGPAKYEDVPLPDWQKDAPEK